MTKKLIMASVIALSIANTAQADMTNPVNQAKVDEIWAVYMPLIKTAEACGNRTESIGITEKMLNYAYSNYATQPFDKDFINLAYQTAELELPSNITSFLPKIKANLTHPKVVEICSNNKQTLLDRIDGYAKKGY